MTNSTKNSIRNLHNRSCYKIVTELGQLVNSISVIKMKSHSVIAKEKNDVMACEINDENDTYSMLKLKMLSVIKFIRSKQTCRHSTYDHI